MQWWQEGGLKSVDVEQIIASFKSPWIKGLYTNNFH